MRHDRRDVLRDLGLPDPPWIVGHRGAAASRPENTLASVAAGLDEGVDMIEVDVQLTADGGLVLVHDWEIELGGRRWIVEECDARDLRAAAVGDVSRDALTALPSLDVLRGTLPDTVPLNLELKRRRADTSIWLESLLPAITARPRTLVSSFDHALLRAIRVAEPGRQLAPIASRGPHELLRAAEEIGAATVHCHRRVAFGDFVTAAATSGWPVLVYTINDAGAARDLFGRGVAGVFTDRPGELRAELRDGEPGGAPDGAGNGLEAS